MIGPTPYRHGRANLLEATGHHPYALLTSSSDPVTVWRAGDALVWRSVGPWGPLVASLGEAEPVTRMLAELAEADLLDGVRWLHLPRSSREELAAYLDVVERSSVRLAD